MVLRPPFHFSDASSPRSLGLTLPPTRFDADEQTGMFNIQGTVYAAGRIVMRGNIGVLCRIEQAGVHEITVNDRVNGETEILAFGVPLIPTAAASPTSALPMSYAVASVSLIAAIEDAVAGAPISTTFPLINENHVGVVPNKKFHRSLAHSSTLQQDFPQPTWLYIYAEVEVVLRAAGIAFAKIDFGSNQDNLISIPFILVERKA